jgi:predicted dehydrogenase/threonine dehydrogenase-like Zn-dependent dehydrogenase
MRQIIRRVIDRKGRVLVVEYPEPHLGPDQVLVENHFSLISSGTEMGTLAKTPAELVRQTLADPWMRHVVSQAVFSAGVVQTGRRIWQEMIMPREIGYSGAGRVLALGDNAEGFRVGDKVAYAATGHAETAAPTINHIVPVPESVDTRHAAFVTVGGIAMQSVRRAELQLGEVIAVYGLGLIGQICCMIAKAAGCVVVGIDLSDERNQLAAQNGADLVINPASSDLQRQIMDFTGKRGVDASIICASSSSSEIINRSMEITRRQGRVVIVGYVKLDIHPKNFLYREIDLRYSRAYGPGSYHRGYEKGRLDYPFEYVRWTEKRNLGEFIRLISCGAIDLQSLIGGTFRVDEAQDAFDSIARGTLSGVAALIDYDSSDQKQPDRSRSVTVGAQRPKKDGKLGIAIIGCGNHVLATHLPNLRSRSDVEIRGLASATGKNADMIAKQLGSTVITTDVEGLVKDQETDAVMICSSQPEHAGHIKIALAEGKPTFVEKPMVTRQEDFLEIAEAMEGSSTLFSLGLNRRYSPMVEKLRAAITGPIHSVSYYITQPFVPPEHWTLDEIDGGGRLITEGEHFIDLCNLLIGSPPRTVFAQALGSQPDDIRKLCNFAITIHYDGAVATIVFNESGAAGHPRERIIALASGTVAVLDDFAKLTVHGKKQTSQGSGLRKQMGHKQQLVQFLRAVKGQPNSLASWQEISTASRCMFAAEDSIRCGQPVAIVDKVLPTEVPSSS